MKKKNKGFILIELLIVAVFTASLFTFLYVNVLPIMGDYEQKEKYDTIDTKYVLYELRKEILTYENTGDCSDYSSLECGTWSKIANMVNTTGFARLHTYKNNYIYPNSDFWEERNETENFQLENEYRNLYTLFTMYHIDSFYITRFGVGEYASGTLTEVEEKNYHSMKTLSKLGTGVLNETKDSENQKLIESAKTTEEYIKKMKNFTLGYEYKREYYRIIACMHPVDLDDVYCGTMELMRK